MSPSDSDIVLPKYLFKIVVEEPDARSETIKLSELDKESGFIHLSTASQVPQTCNLFFSTSNKLHIIKFPYSKIRHRTRWEHAPDREELFPHVYGELGIAEMHSVRTFYKGENTWTDVLGEETWLFESETNIGVQ
jgi:uncharacterized protein (DUF952 family)